MMKSLAQLLKLACRLCRVNCLGLLLVSMAFLFSLTGCAPRTARSAAQYMSTNARQAKLQTITAWQASGVFGIQNLQTGKGFVVNYRWWQKAAYYQIDFNAALNFVSATLVGRPGFVDFRRGNKHYSAKSAQSLLQQQLGWSMPVLDTTYWLRGLPAPGTAQVSYDQFGRLQMLKQDGWVIHYLEYIQYKGIDLPLRITLTNLDYNIRMVVKKWSI